mmetsp:Transcript_36826/g.113649  ORF Transcript_36826/g.113649 Transcript_36826/m.113649 type:complete len:377 (-) Transcript_36826:234-1364(-)
MPSAQPLQFDGAEVLDALLPGRLLVLHLDAVAELGLQERGLLAALRLILLREIGVPLCDDNAREGAVEGDDAAVLRDDTGVQEQFPRLRVREELGEGFVPKSIVVLETLRELRGDGELAAVDAVIKRSIAELMRRRGHGPQPRGCLLGSRSRVPVAGPVGACRGRRAGSSGGLPGPGRSRCVQHCRHGRRRTARCRGARRRATRRGCGRGSCRFTRRRGRLRLRRRRLWCRATGADLCCRCRCSARRSRPASRPRRLRRWRRRWQPLCHDLFQPQLRCPRGLTGAAQARHAARRSAGIRRRRRCRGRFRAAHPSVRRLLHAAGRPLRGETGRGAGPRLRARRRRRHAEAAAVAAVGGVRIGVIVLRRRRGRSGRHR